VLAWHLYFVVEVVEDVKKFSVFNNCKWSMMTKNPYSDLHPKLFRGIGRSMNEGCHLSSLR